MSTPRQRVEVLFGAVGCSGNSVSEFVPFGFENGLQEREFAKVLVGPAPRGDADPTTLASRQAEYDTVVETELKALKNRHNKPAYSGLCGQQVPIGGQRLEWRWYLPKPETGVGE